MPLITETPRLLIRTWELEDIAALCELTHQEGLSEFSISNYLNFTPDQATEWIKTELLRFKEHRLGKFAVILKEQNVPIGISGLFHRPAPDNLGIELNYRYPKSKRGQGFATEAAKSILDYGFEVLGLTCINANADLRNFRSHNVLKRLGMKYVGEVSYHDVKAGRWGITRSAEKL